MIFLDFLITLVIILILYFGMEPGPYTIWIIAGVGVGIFIVCHFITTKISDSMSDGLMGMGRGGLAKESSKLGKLIGFLVFMGIVAGIAFGIYYLVTQQSSTDNKNSLLMNGKFPLPKDITFVGDRLVIEGDNSEYTIAGNEQITNQILEKANGLSSISEQEKWAEHYYNIGMKYYTFAKENKEGWDTKACYAFARNNFSISSQLPSSGTVKIESQAALLDCLHELRKPD